MPYDKIKEKDVAILPSDKTKRLVALNPGDYKELLIQALNPEDKVNRSTLPSTRQQKFNLALSCVANRYKDTDTAKRLLQCKVSEPLPSKPYGLPKDHKEGPLTCRPIISTCDSSVRQLSVLMSNTLNPLIPCHVEAHLPSTTHFISSIQHFTMEPEYTFGSLDVCNLYGSIPL